MATSLKQDGTRALGQGGATGSLIQSMERTAITLSPPPGQLTTIPEQPRQIQASEPTQPAAAPEPTHVELALSAPATPAPAQEPELTQNAVEQNQRINLDQAVQEQPRIKDVLAQRMREIIIRRIERKTEPEEPPEMVVLYAVGILTFVTVGAAFTLSYTMLHMVTQAIGWVGFAAAIGPLVPDALAGLAAALLVYRTERAVAWGTLIASTGMSILGNLAGHSIQKALGTTVFHLGSEWAWVGDTFSVFVPVAMAVSLHVFLKKLSAHLAFKKAAKKEEAEKRQAIAEQRAAEQRAAEQAKREEAAERDRQKRELEMFKAAWKAPSEGQQPTKEVAQAVCEFLGIQSNGGGGNERLDKFLRTALGYGTSGFSTRKKWISQANQSGSADTAAA